MKRLGLAVAAAAAAVVRLGDPGPDDAARRPGRGSRCARSDAGAHLRRSHRLRVALRQALRHRRQAQHRAAAGAVARDLRGRQDGHHQAAPGRQVPRRRGHGRRGGQGQPGAAHDHAGLVPQARACRRRQGRGGGRRDRATAPQEPLLAADRPAGRPCRHDPESQGGEGGGRQVRVEAGVRRAIQVRRARAAGSHRGREVRRSTGMRPTCISTGSSSGRSSSRPCASPISSRAAST